MYSALLGNSVGFPLIINLFNYVIATSLLLLPLIGQCGWDRPNTCDVVLRDWLLSCALELPRDHYTQAKKEEQNVFKKYLILATQVDNVVLY